MCHAAAPQGPQPHTESSSVVIFSLSLSVRPSVRPQNALIRELDHTKKLIEESHHEKVCDRLSLARHSSCRRAG